MRVAALREQAFILFSLAFVLFAGGCKEGSQYVAPPPPSVTVVLPVQRDVVDYLEFTGTTQAIASVDIGACVHGFLESVHFKGGAVLGKADLF